MKSVKKLLGRKLFLAVLVLAFISCGNSGEQKEDQSNNPVAQKKKSAKSENNGSIELSLSGDIQGERVGVADFYHLKKGPIEFWGISAHHGRVGKEKFSFDLRIQALNEEIPQPKPGTYKIELAPNSIDIFNASFIDIIDQENHVQKEYGARGEAGTLTIEVSNEKQVKGHFEFTAHSVDEMGEASDRITVKGKFDAVDRMRNQ